MLLYYYHFTPLSADKVNQTSCKRSGTNENSKDLEGKHNPNNMAVLNITTNAVLIKEEIAKIIIMLTWGLTNAISIYSAYFRRENSRQGIIKTASFSQLGRSSYRNDSLVVSSGTVFNKLVIIRGISRLVYGLSSKNKSQK